MAERAGAVSERLYRQWSAAERPHLPPRRHHPRHRSARNERLRGRAIDPLHLHRCAPGLVTSFKRSRTPPR